MIWDRDKWLAFVNRIMNLLHSIQCWEFLDWPRTLLNGVNFILFYGMQVSTKAL
jgi:hypothetical protein